MGNQGRWRCPGPCRELAARVLRLQWRLIVTIAAGVGVHACPRPEGIDPEGWGLVAVFVGTIVGILLETLPSGACALIGASIAVLIGSLPFSAAFKGFSQEAPWLITIAIFLSTGINKMQLGQRITCNLVYIFGSSALGLTYSLVISEFLLGPGVPNVASRSGAILLPIIRSMAEICGSKPSNGTEKKLGAYLMVTCFQTAAVTSATFLTASPLNPFSTALAKHQMHQEFTWLTWVKGAIVPAFLDIMLIPLVVWVVYPPQMTDTTEAKYLASNKLRLMGRMKPEEWTMLGAMVITVVLWLVGPVVGISTIVAAAIGIMIALVLELIEWKDCLAAKTAWNTITWLSVLTAMANQLSETGVTDVMQRHTLPLLKALEWHWFPSVLLLAILYVYIHHLIASSIAHVAALYTFFLALAMSVGGPPLLASLIFGYFSNMMETISPFCAAHGPLFLGQGYVSLPAFLGIGVLVSAFNVVVWMGVGPVWWSFVGFWN
ncbi:unnamed protein product [Ostreobium quekettii]|uniref:Sodium/sulfate symporter n=1 Tax=Ostreobium quekettii TaxID=121088 RepID=A0A8S1J8V5_9CHLO|nr:unnamed protein product [Ostreobium quekettii]